MILIVALILLDLLAVWALIVSRKVNWLAIIISLVLVAFVNFSVARAFNSGAGWPVKGDPAPGLFEGCIVHQPWIYIIDVPTKQQHPRVGFISTVGSPRMFQVPYSQQLEKMCMAAEKAGQAGVPQVIGPKSKQHGQSGSPGTHTPHFHFYNLPPASLGTKP